MNSGAVEPVNVSRTSGVPLGSAARAEVAPLVA
jgi:hypothetical protein